MAAGSLALGINSIGRPSSRQTTPRLIAVSMGMVQSTVSATGNVQAPGSLAVNFKTGGLLTQVMVSPGQRVEKGAVLATIDDTDLRATLANAQSNLATAQARLTQTTMGLTPQEQLQNQSRPSRPRPPSTRPCSRCKTPSSC